MAAQSGPTWTRFAFVFIAAALVALGILVFTGPLTPTPSPGERHVQSRTSDWIQSRSDDLQTLDQASLEPGSRTPVVPEPAPAPVMPEPSAAEPYYPPKDGIARLAEDIRHDIGKLRELKLAGTAERIVSWSTYLREDLLGRSYPDPVPAEVMKNLKTYSTFTGPNGARTYVFTPDEYPLYTEVKARVMKGEPYEKVVDDEFLEQVIAYAEETLAWIGPRPK